MHDFLASMDEDALPAEFTQAVGHLAAVEVVNRIVIFRRIFARGAFSQNINGRGIAVFHPQDTLLDVGGVPEESLLCIDGVIFEHRSAGDARRLPDEDGVAHLR